MPELPEVENTRRNLVRAGLPGCTITGANITWANTVKKPSAAELGTGPSRTCNVAASTSSSLSPAAALPPSLCIWA